MAPDFDPETEIETRSRAGIVLVAGLGNPCPRYRDTRHNAGFWFVNYLAAKYGARFRPQAGFHGETCVIRVGAVSCRLLKPATFMNRSGQALAAVCRFYRITPERMLAAHDEIDFPVARVRFKQGGGHGGHNGLRDIISALGSSEFLRLRIGVGHPADRPTPAGLIAAGCDVDVMAYVLSRPPAAERTSLEGAIRNAADSLPDLMSGAVQKAIQRLHNR